MEKVSIIIPVFNTARYLPECLESILKQTYANFEVILVDDGSTDSSLKICEQFSQQDHRVRVIHQQNSGVAIARNHGLAVAHGGLIEFIDSDDFVGEEHLELLIKALHQYNADIATCTFYRIDQNGTYYFYTNDNDPAQQALVGVHKPLEWLQEAVKHPINISAAVVDPVCKLYRKELFKHIEYPLNRHNGEDVNTTWKLILAAHRIAYINVGNYCYRMNTSSSTSIRNYANDLAGDLNVINGLQEKMVMLNRFGGSITNPAERFRYLLDPIEQLGNHGSPIASKNARFIKTVLQKFHHE